MRILLINSWYFPNMKGGAEQSTKLLAENLAAKGHIVAVLTGDGTKDTFETEIINGVSIYRSNTYLGLNPENTIHKIFLKMKDLKNRQIKQVFNDVCNHFLPDLVHSNSLSGLSFWIWKLAFDRGIPVIHTVRDYSLCSPRGIYESVANTRFPYHIFLTYYQFAAKKYANYVSYITAPSDFTLSLLLENGYFKHVFNSCVVNAVPLDMNFVCSCIAERKRRKRHGKIIIFVGRLIKIKGVELLLTTFKKIKGDDLRLYICGEGECEEIVEQAIRTDHRIFKFGQLTQEELEQKYMDADFAVVPSLWDEPFGRVVIEANKYGLPVLASNRGGIPEIIRETQGGILFDAYSEDDFEKKLKIMIDYPDYTEFYEHIKKSIEMYSIDKQVENFELIYKRLVN